MMVRDTWPYQGRQEHGWWGHGTAPHADKPGRPNPPAPDTPERRATVASHGAIAHMKRDLARAYEIALQYGMNGHFQRLVAAHPATASLDDGAYRTRILDGTLTPNQTGHLRRATAITHGARTLDALSPASEAMADLVTSAGIWNTGRGLATGAAKAALYDPGKDGLPLLQAKVQLSPGSLLPDELPVAPRPSSPKPLPLSPGLVRAALALLAAAATSEVAVPVALLLAAGFTLSQLLPDEKRGITAIPVVGHPGDIAVLDSKTAQIVILRRGQDGAYGIIRLDLKSRYSPGVVDGLLPIFALEDAAENKLGSYFPSDQILLSPEGEAALNATVSQHGVGIVTRNREEEELVATLLAQGRSDLEIQRALDDLRSRRAGPDDGEISKDRRNRGLPKELWTDKNKYRKAAIANDKKLTEAIERDKNSGKTAKEKLTEKDVTIHHVIPMKPVRDDPDLFQDGEWRPDQPDNTRPLPKDKPEQKKIEDMTGEKRPIHKGGHKKWNDEVQEDIDKMKRKIKRSNLKRGDPGYREAVKKGFNDLLKRLNERLRHRDVVVNDRPYQGAA